VSASAPAQRLSRCGNCGDTYAPGVLRCPRDGSLLGESADPLSGAVLAGRYRIAARLGRGGMSTVYLARHVVIDRLAAVKVLRRDLAADPLHRGRFLQEARAVNRIQHENIVDVTDYGETSDGVVYLVMEYLPGESLLGALCAGPLPVLRALDIARQIAAGLGRAHEMRVIHRDLKPDNIVLVPKDRGRERVKILDFGIAKLLDEPALTLNQRVFGTPGYIAPEYATGSNLSTQADLYSLGVVLYEMVTGALPFEARHPGELLLRTATEPPIPPSARLPTLPDAVEALILRCLEKAPQARHRDAFHFLDEVDEILASLRRDPVASSAPSRVSGSYAGALVVPGVGDGDDAPTRIQEALREDTTRRMAAPSALDDPSPPTPVTPVAQGVLDLRCPAGLATLALAEAWRAFLDALRGRIAAQYWAGAPRDVAVAMDSIDGVVEAIRQESERAELAGVRMLGLESRGRDFRLTIGHAMDTLAADLSARTRERDAIAAARDASAARRAAAPRDETLLWEFAAAEQLLAEVVRSCEDVEFQRATLRAQIDHLNEALEREQAEILADLTRALDAVRAGDASLRALVDDLDARVSRDALGASAPPRSGAQHG